MEMGVLQWADCNDDGYEVKSSPAITNLVITVRVTFPRNLSLALEVGRL